MSWIYLKCPKNNIFATASETTIIMCNYTQNLEYKTANSWKICECTILTMMNIFELVTPTIVRSKFVEVNFRFIFLLWYDHQSSIFLMPFTHLIRCEKHWKIYRLKIIQKLLMASKNISNLNRSSFYLFGMKIKWLKSIQYRWRILNWEMRSVKRQAFISTAFRQIQTQFIDLLCWKGNFSFSCFFLRFSFRSFKIDQSTQTFQRILQFKE